MSLAQFKDIRHFIFDIDGVLTNGQLLISVEGNLLRNMNIKDGYAMQLALKQGYTISIISGAREESILKRLAGLGIHDVHLGISQKLSKLEEIASNGQLSLPHTLYMGDDMPDLEVMKHVALPCCPADACEEIIAASTYVSPKLGGQGCVRDVIEKVLKLNHHWQ
ncbi:MAG TPA: HAD hydrolase family protein [Chitinophagaceae bacterium]|nr:HAD hydrolase family protein [Chitinophagaceae bacterium]